MNRREKEFIKLLKTIVHNQKVNKEDFKEWDKLFQESNNQELLTLIFGNIKLLEENNNIEKWKSKTIHKIIKEKRCEVEVREVFEKLKEFGVDGIALKGTILKNFYTKKQYREMKDIDILVKEEELKKTDEILKKMGYVKVVGEHDVHVTYIAKERIPIEIHWKLINEDFCSKNNFFEEDIWQDLIEVDFNNTKLKSLSYENMFIHLIFHIAVHLAYSGFGMRQVLDIYYLSEKSNLNWEIIKEKIEKYNLEKLTGGIILTCNELFDFKIPDEMKAFCNLSKRYVENIIKETFKDGVSGKKDKGRVFTAEIAFDKESRKYNENKEINRKFLRLIFPKIHQMSNRYSYAKRNKILVPVAWIHHFINGIFRNEYSIWDKVKILILTPLESKKRSKLLKELNL